MRWQDALVTPTRWETFVVSEGRSPQWYAKMRVLRKELLDEFPYGNIEPILAEMRQMLDQKEHKK